MLQELVCYVFLSCLVYVIPAKPPAASTHKKNPAAYPGMTRNQIQLHGLLNKSKKKNSTIFILLHIDSLFLDFIAENVDHVVVNFQPTLPGVPFVDLIQEVLEHLIDLL